MTFASAKKGALRSVQRAAAKADARFFADLPTRLIGDRGSGAASSNPQQLALNCGRNRFVCSDCASSVEASSSLVPSECRVLPPFAEVASKIVRISSVLGRQKRLLICGLRVRFPPGSPLFRLVRRSMFSCSFLVVRILVAAVVRTGNVDKRIPVSNKQPSERTRRDRLAQHQLCGTPKSFG